jgi:hypothetical protein
MLISTANRIFPKVARELPVFLTCCKTDARCGIIQSAETMESRPQERHPRCALPQGRLLDYLTGTPWSEDFLNHYVAALDRSSTRGRYRRGAYRGRDRQPATRNPPPCISMTGSFGSEGFGKSEGRIKRWGKLNNTPLSPEPCFTSRYFF